MKQIALCFVLIVLVLKTKANFSTPMPAQGIHFQDDSKKQLTVEEKLKKYEGTFQIQVVNPRQKPSIPYNIDELIEKNRNSTEVVYVQLGTEVRLKVLPLSQIKNKGANKFEMISTYN